jgi:hypothetical protein
MRPDDLIEMASSNPNRTFELLAQDLLGRPRQGGVSVHAWQSAAPISRLGIASPVVGIVKVSDPIAGQVTGKLLWMSCVLPRP